jgi:hypothetical protein
LPRLERQINAALAAHWPKKLRSRSPVEVAMDFHDRPYYGKSEQATGVWARGEAKDGATRFYRVATAYAIVRGQRVTLAIRFVLLKQERVEVLADLWRSLRQRALRISCLYLDKGFASVAVFDYLKPARNSVGGDDRLQRSRLFIAIVITQIFARNKNRVSLAA